ncbi:Rrf2 family transcriptional regulator [Sneathiella marina]|uniref:Rrf2 family transcriptional regulator n=2 Tax=Sneathiella marina TaxID=2950108 RepID=A0ABY4W7V1_9PROT|nr:Rrf2 family transcriptional regulator [Sneathiella marina]
MAASEYPVKSEILARVMQTNPVVIRRILGRLRDCDLVRSEKGHGGGWTLACNLEVVTLRDIHVALGAPGLIAIGNRNETPSCLVEKAVNAALNDTFKEAEALLLDRFGRVTLATLSTEFHAGMLRHRGRNRQEHAHEER